MMSRASLMRQDDGEPKPDHLLLAVGDDHESWSDDPVRMYLTQMGEIPLLTCRQEIARRRKSRSTRRPVSPQAAGVRLPLFSTP